MNKETEQIVQTNTEPRAAPCNSALGSDTAARLYTLTFS